MKSRCAMMIACLLGVMLLVLPGAVQAQFTFTTNSDGTLNINHYTGSEGTVVIPSTTNGLTVASIGLNAFANNLNMTNVIIPDSIINIGKYAFTQSGLLNVTIPYSVTNIGQQVFWQCDSLTAITVDPLNSYYSSLDGVLFDQSQTTLIQCPEAKAGAYLIPNTVDNVAWFAVQRCYRLTSVTIPKTVSPALGKERLNNAMV